MKNPNTKKQKIAYPIIKDRRLDDFFKTYLA